MQNKNLLLINANTLKKLEEANKSHKLVTKIDVNSDVMEEIIKNTVDKTAEEYTGKFKEFENKLNKKDTIIDVLIEKINRDAE